MRVLIATFRYAAPARCAAFVMSGASLPGRRRMGVLASLRVPGRVVRRGFERWGRHCSFRTSALIAIFHCAAPARCGAVADERRVVGGDGGDERGRNILVQSLGQCGPADCHKVGSRTDIARLIPTCSSPPSVALRACYGAFAAVA